jgi:Ca2+-binding RTX toxin-like protein
MPDLREIFGMSDPYTDLGVIIVSADGIIEGTDGRDILIATGGGATLRGGWGDDTLVGGSGNDSLEGGRISLFNHPDSNLLVGGSGDDTLRGHFGDDTLLGDDGNDVLIGSAGANTLTGGTGADLFVFGHGAPATAFRQIGQDTITDFAQGEDQIDLSALNYLGGTDDLAYTFIGEAAFSGTRPEARAYRQGDQTAIELDTQFFANIPVDGVADGIIVLTGSLVLTDRDFLL